MKKLISISVVLILLASAAFADVGATVIGQATLVKGSTEEFADGGTTEPLYATAYNTTGYNISRIRLSASGALEDGTLGGSLRYDAGSDGSNPSAWGWAWWKPSDLIKFQIGANPDGEFGLDGIGRWGFYQLAGDAGVASEGWAFSSAFFGGWGGRGSGWGEPSGIILNITPVDGLAINVGIPIDSGTAAFREYKNSTIQVKYNIDGVGTAGLTYRGAQGEEDVLNDNPTVIAYFGLSSIENLGIDIGIGYQFGDSVTNKDLPDGSGGTFNTTNTVSNPLAIGLGVSFSSGSFGVKTRVLGELMASEKFESTQEGFEAYTLNGDMKVVFDILPYFVINDNMTFYLSAGIQTITGNDKIDAEESAKQGKVVIVKDESADFSWHVNPYICITPSYWTAAFFAGLRIDSPSDKYTKADKEGKTTDYRWINWSIPIGIIVNF